MKPVDILKWVATAIPLLRHGQTGLNTVPINVFFFLVGIVMWFTVGFLWKDRAIMVVHLGAFAALLIGYLNAPVVVAAG